MSSKAFEFVTEGDIVEITVDEHVCDSDGFIDGTQGHLYYISGQFTLGDLATLARLLQRFEAPGISAQGWARLRDNGARLREVEP